MLWKDVSITRKLYLVIGTMAVLLAIELFTLRFATHTLGAVRAFVGGEGLWSKAQKDAAFSIERFAITHDERDYQAFLEYLKVPEADHAARLALMKQRPDLALVQRKFVEGGIHPSDVPLMVSLLQRFSHVSYLARAINDWTEGDRTLAEFKLAGERYHALINAHAGDPPDVGPALVRIQHLNSQLTVLENEFSEALGEGSRWLDGIVVLLVTIAVLMVESVGLTLTFLTARNLSRGLEAVQQAAVRIGQGDFGRRVEVRSSDELGRVGEAINQMGRLLEHSYGELEVRVRERTADLAKLAEENARLYERASAAVRMRDEFFSIASHEIKTPISALILQLQMLARLVKRTVPAGPEAAKVDERINACVRQSHRLALLSSELMDLTHIRLGKLDLNLERSDLSALTRDAVSDLADEAAAMGIVLNVQANAPVFGRFDQTRLSQVINNLVSNAIKYGEGRPIEVTVETVRDGEAARLVVQDHGRGIAPEDRFRIFDRFQRAEPDPKVAGLGLGLYITRQIVEAHGGTISVESEPGEGSTFTVELAVSRSDEGGASPVAAAPAGG